MPEVIISGFKVVLGVLFVLGVAINIHEFGHFIVQVSKLRKCVGLLRRVWTNRDLQIVFSFYVEKKRSEQHDANAAENATCGE